MDDAAGVRGGDAAGDLLGVPDGATRRERPLLQPRSQRLAVHELGDDVRRRRPMSRAGRRVAEFVDRENVRVRELRDAQRLALEACERVGIGGERRGEDLDGDEAVQARVARFPDFAHSARADGIEDFVRTEAVTWGQWHR